MPYHIHMAGQKLAPCSNRTNVKSGVSALSSTSTAFGTAAANTRLDSHTNGIDESLKQQVLAEEEAAMNQYKAKVSSPTSGSAPSTNPFLSSPTSGASNANQPIVDLFGSPTSGTDAAQAKVSSPTSGSAPSTNPFLSSPTSGASNANQPIVDLFGSPTSGTDAAQSWVDRTVFPSNTAQISLQGANCRNQFNVGDVFNEHKCMDWLLICSLHHVLFSLQAASAGMAAPNPFMSDFSPAPGGQHAPSSSSAVGGGMGLFDDQGSDAAGQIEAGGDLFGADFGSVVQAQAPTGGAQGADLFGDVSESDATVLQPSEATGISLGFEEGAGESAAVPSVVSEDAKLPEGASSGAEEAEKPQQAFPSFPTPVPPAPAPSPVMPPGAGKITSPPPPRPPPPSTAPVSATAAAVATAAPAGGTPRTMSPGPMSGSPGRPPPVSAAANAASKSAFDDLNDSIRAALGGSPTRPPPPAGAAAQMPGQSVPPVQAGAPGFGGGAGIQGFGSFDIPGGAVIPPQPQGMMPGGGGMVFAPVNAGGPQTGDTAAGKVLTGDLDSSLASLAQNLSINKGGQASVKGVQWNSPKNVAKPGGTGWTPQPMAATTGAGYRPMGQGMTSMNAPVQFPSLQPMVLCYPLLQGMQAMQGMRPMGAAPMMGGAGMMGGGGGMMGSPRIGGSPGVMGQQQPPTQPPQGAQSLPLDPFGAL
ncbi:hypothetical protein C0J52_09512 [Blattella germanica]|nr:hypothetical protein C0J52_09512 [Blattella germanica]